MENATTGNWASVFGGQQNRADGSRSVVVGGRESDTFANWSTIVGGDNGFMFSGTDNQRDTIVGNEPFDDTCSF